MKAMSTSPSRPVSDPITMGTSSRFDRLMMSMGTQRGGASSSTGLQPQLTSSFLGLTTVLGSASDMRGRFVDVLTGLEEMRQDMTKRIDRVEGRAQQGHERLREELANSRANCDKVQQAQITYQCLAESLARANKESEEKDRRLTREKNQLLNNHVSTSCQTRIKLESILDAKADLMMRKLDEFLNRNNRESRSNPRGKSHWPCNGLRAPIHTKARSRACFESKQRERPRAASWRPGWTDPIRPDVEAPSGAPLTLIPHARSIPDLTTVSHDTTRYASMFEPLNRSLKTFITKLRSLLREQKGHEEHSRNQSHTKMSQTAALILG